MHHNKIIFFPPPDHSVDCTQSKPASCWDCQDQISNYVFKITFITWNQTLQTLRTSPYLPQFLLHFLISSSTEIFLHRTKLLFLSQGKKLNFNHCSACHNPVESQHSYTICSSFHPVDHFCFIILNQESELYVINIARCFSRHLIYTINMILI